MPSVDSFKWELFAPVMALLEPFRRRTLRRALETLNGVYPLDGRQVLDIGAGTGTLVAELSRYDCHVAAVEPSYTMARIARIRFPKITVHEAPADRMACFSDRSIDIALLVSTLHGFSPAYRARVYAELRRVVRDAVVIIDYHSNGNPVVAVAEWIEGGDYFSFVKNVNAELAATFPKVEQRTVSSFESLYFAWLHEP